MPRVFATAATCLVLLVVSRAQAQCEVAKLVAPDAGVGDLFGFSVSLSGDVLVVGAPFLDGAAADTGAAYVFRRDGETWPFEAKLTASDPAERDQFGKSVGASGDTVVIGAVLDDCVTEVECGAAYVFRFVDGVWVEEARLQPEDAAEDDSFGISVAISGNVIVVGASGDDDIGSNSGSAYVYEFDGVDWVEHTKLIASDSGPSSWFGDAVSVDGSVAVVGATRRINGQLQSAYVWRQGSPWTEEALVTPSDNSPGDFFGGAVSISGDAFVVGASRDEPAGSAYVYRFNGVDWNEETKLVPLDPDDSDRFGNSVSILGDTIVAGAALDDCADGTENCGSAYVFRLEDSAWVEVAKLTASDVSEQDVFGGDVSFDGDFAVVGSQSDNGALEGAGAVYVFRVLGGPDCNANGVNDACEPDCNENKIPDSCDISVGTSFDCDGNGIPNECDLDCNVNGVSDNCDIISGTSQDCDLNGVPDDCEVEACPGPSCQLPPDGLAYMSDLTMPPSGVVVADDFVPAADTITHVDVWGVYLDAYNGSISGLSPRHECLDPVVDEFRVRVFADDNAMPGALLGEAVVTGADIARTPTVGTLFEDLYYHVVQGYELSLDVPIGGLVIGETHWLEVSNNTVEPAGNTCRWHWIQHMTSETDAYCVSGTNDRPGENPGSGYIKGGEKAADLSFCLGGAKGPVDFGPGSAPLGACCFCPDLGGTCSTEKLLPCQSDLGGIWNRADPTCKQPCEPTLGDLCASGPIAIGDGLSAFDTTCSDTDGPFAYGPYLEWPPFENDIWLTYQASCNGNLTVSTCASQNGFTQDGWTGPYNQIVLYHDPENPTECPCPSEAYEFQATIAITENCNGLLDGNGAILEEPVCVGECWLIRIGAIKDFVGSGILEVSCEEDSCEHAGCFVQPSAPQPEMIPDQFGIDVISTKNRFLSFSAGDAGVQQAIRVMFNDLPPPYDEWNGTVMWLDEPQETSENGSTRDPIPGFPTFWAATLRCDPLFADWSAVGTVHVHHEGIVPGATYSIDVVEEGCFLTGSPIFSTAIQLPTSLWGDTVRDCSVTPCTPPDGSISIIDVVAILGRFTSASDSIVKARADLEPADLDLLINVTDVLNGVNAFVGLVYPASPSTNNPCTG